MHTRSSSRIPSDHARHDRLLVTRLAADDSFPAEMAEARALIDACTHCSALAADIRLLRAATSELPAPRRPRDFRLSAEQAEALRGSALERFLRRFAAPGLAPVRPLAGVALSLGLALAVVGTALPAPVLVDDSQENAAIFATDTGRNGEPASGEGPGSVPPPLVAEPGGAEEGAGPEPQVTTEEDSALQSQPTADSALRDVLIYAGLLLALLSFAMLSIVYVARRRWVDPLLR